MNCAYIVEHIEVNRAEQIVASRGTVVQNTQIWDHHFPEFPILPGVLVLDVLKATAEKWYDSGVQVRSVQRVRFSNYLKPVQLSKRGYILVLFTKPVSH